MRDPSDTYNVLNEPQSNNRLPDFPVRLLIMIIGLTFLAIIMVISLSYLNTRSFADLHQRSLAVSQMQHNIAYEDQALTMAARLAAASGDVQWAREYDAHLDPMDKALKTSAALAPSDAHKAFITKTSAANDALVEMETRALDAVRAGDQAAAITIMDSKEYAAQKTVLSKGAAQFDAATNNAMLQQRHSLNLRSNIAEGFTVFICVLLVTGWWRLYRVLRRWRGEIAELLENEQEIAAQVQMQHENAQKILKDTVAKVEHENKKLNETEAIQRRNLVNEVAEKFEASIGNIMAELSTSSVQLVRSAQDMSAITMQAESEFGLVSGSIDKTSHEMNEVAYVAESMSTLIENAGRHASDSADIVSNAAGQASQMIDQVRSLADDTKRIGTIVELISDVATKTNLLALNATIEAARAGDAGRGFAVVANEVKQLAQQTASATLQITELVAQVQGYTEKAVESGEVTAGAMDEIKYSAQVISEKLNQQRENVSNLSQRANTVVIGSKAMASGIATVSIAALKAGEASGNMLTAANVVASQSEMLDRELKALIVGLRAA
jgi:methyl-accepting chemotaxis protein